MERLPLFGLAVPNLSWSMNFVMDALAPSRWSKCLTCVDDITKAYLTIIIVFGILGAFR